MTLDSYAQRDLGAVLGTELGASSAERLAMLAQRHDWVDDNVNLGERVYDRKSAVAGLQCLWQPAKSTSVLVKLHGDEVE